MKCDQASTKAAECAEPVGDVQWSAEIQKFLDRWSAIEEEERAELVGDAAAGCQWFGIADDGDEAGGQGEGILGVYEQLGTFNCDGDGLRCALGDLGADGGETLLHDQGSDFLDVSAQIGKPVGKFVGSGDVPRCALEDLGAGGGDALFHGQGSEGTLEVDEQIGRGSGDALRGALGDSGADGFDLDVLPEQGEECGRAEWFANFEAALVDMSEERGRAEWFAHCGAALFDMMRRADVLGFEAALSDMMRRADSLGDEAALRLSDWLDGMFAD